MTDGEGQDKQPDKWRCADCGMVYDNRPGVCPDCTGGEFNPVRTPSPDQPSEASPATGARDELISPTLTQRLFRGRVPYVVAIILVIVVAALFFGSGTGFLAPDPCADVSESAGDSTTLNREYVECETHEQLMQVRNDEGASSLRFSPELRDTGRNYAEQMAQNGWSVSEARREIGSEPLSQACSSDNDGQTNLVSFHKLYFNTRVESTSGDTDVYNTNRELARGLVDNSRDESGSIGSQASGCFQRHGVGIHFTTDKEVYFVQIYC